MSEPLARRRWARPRVRLEALFWIALLAFLGYRIWPQVAAAFGVASASAAAPDFQLVTLDGTPISGDALRGKVVLVNFWATWCPPCRVEMPGFQDVYDRRRAEGFTILGVSTDAAGRAHVERYLRRHGITYPVAMASGGIVRDFGGARALPTSFLLDRQGRIRHTVTGIFAELTLDQAVARLLAEPAEGAPTDAAPPVEPVSGGPRPVGPLRQAPAGDAR
jgi:peroxiredoxin